jgi:hypothetical protein
MEPKFFRYYVAIAVSFPVQTKKQRRTLTAVGNEEVMR